MQNAQNLEHEYRYFEQPIDTSDWKHRLGTGVSILEYMSIAEVAIKNVITGALTGDESV